MKSYHFSHHLLHELWAFFHFSSWASKLHDVTFLCWVREVDDDLNKHSELMKCITRLEADKWKISAHLWEFIPHFLYLLPFLANDGSVKTLFNDQVLWTLVLLQETIVQLETQTHVQNFACELKHQPTMRDASSRSSFLASCTPCGSPSMRIRLLFSLSGGMRTVTLCTSFMRLTIN